MGSDLGYGLDGFVTPETYAEFRTTNLTGNVRQRLPTVTGLMEEIRKYDPAWPSVAGAGGHASSAAHGDSAAHRVDPVGHRARVGMTAGAPGGLSR